MRKTMTLCAALLMTSMSMQAQKTMTPPAGGKAISDHLIGIFFEDISSSADLATRSDAWNHAWTPHSTPTIPPTCGCILSA